MKILTTIFLSLFIIASIHVYGGKNKKGYPEQPVTLDGAGGFYKKGVYNFNMNQAMGFRASGIKNDGDKVGNSFRSMGDIELNYNVIDHFGVGVGLDMGSSNRKNTSVDPETSRKRNSFGGHVNLIYSARIADVMNFYAKASAGYGTRKYIDVDSDGENSYNRNSFNLEFSVGAPIHVTRNIFFTPSVNYILQNSKEEGIKDRKSGLAILANMDIYMGCGDSYCHGNDGERDGWYRPGTVILGSRLKGKFNFGTIKTTYENESDYEQKESYGNAHIAGSALYYFIPNLAAGADLDVSFDKTSSKDYDHKVNKSDLVISGIVRYNIPVEGPANNIYVQGSIGGGFSNEKTINSSTTKDNSSIFDWTLGAGYFYRISENFGLTPEVGVDSRTTKQKDSDTKRNSTGVYGGIGLAMIF